MPKVAFRLKPAGTRRPLKLYSVCKSTNSACFYYRCYVPWRTAEEMGLLKYKIDDYEKMDNDARLSTIVESEIHAYYLILDKHLIKRIRFFNTMKDSWSKKHNRKMYSPRTVFDSDDDLERVDPYNPKFVTLGTHSPEGQRLRPGDSIVAPAGEGGEHMPLWVDGKVYGEGVRFDIKRNNKALELCKATARMAAGCTVTCDALATIYRGYGAKNVYIYPNSIRFQDYPKIDLVHDPKVVKILWQGGWSHYRDWYPLQDAIRHVSEKYPQARFIIWGQQYRWVHAAIPPTRREFLGWMPHDAYILRLSTIGHDINLAPLADTRFNRCKSAIKWYESSALHRPAATLAQRNGPYGAEIQDRKTGLLFDTPEEFETKLGELIEDATLRQELATNAKQWVWENRRAEVTTPGLIDWYWSLLE